MKRLRVIAIIVMIFVFSFALTACGEKSEIKKTISNFEDACQNADVESALDCFSPTTASTIRMGLALVGVNDINEQFAELLEVVGFIDFSGGSISEVLESINIKPKEFDFNEKKTSCTVTGLLQYEVGGTKKEAEIKIKLKKDDEKWYISLVY